MRDDYLPARIGQGQLQLVANDLTHAKLNFEKIVSQHPQCAEAAVILGCIYANEVFQASLKDDKSVERKRASLLLEKGKRANDARAKREDDLPLYYLLSRLHEPEDIDVSLKCMPLNVDFLTCRSRGGIAITARAPR